MSSEFAIDTLEFGDDAGWGEWLVGHYRQHLRYNLALSIRTPPIIIKDYPILTIEGGKIGLRFWLDAHSNWHDDLRPLANVTGIDLSEVDFTKSGEFYQWIDLHNQEHAIFDQVFGVG